MSRFILLVVGFIAGWFIKDSNWKEWLENLKSPQQQPTQKPISLLAEEAQKTEPAQEEDEIFADVLEKLPGIGPASKTKLNDKGIFTFAQVAALTAEELKEIAGARVKAEDAIQQAKELTS